MAMRIVGLIHKLTDCAAVAAGLVVLALMLSMVFEVVMRYFFNAPTLWAFEVVMVVCGSAWALSGSYITMRRSHIAWR